MREAAWLTTEGNERQIDRHEGYVLCPEFFRRAKIQTGLVALGVAVLATTVVASAARADLYPMALFAVAGLSLGAIPLARHWELRQEARRAPDVALQEGFGKGPGQFVELIVRQGDAPTGIDRGMLWTEDGRLYFSGHRTSFGLVPSQVRLLTTRNDPVPGLRHEIVLRLGRETPVGSVSLSFGVFVPINMSSERERHALAARLDAWKDGRSREEGQWPPVAAGPGAPTERRLLLEAVFLSLPLPLAFLVLGLVSGSLLAWAAALGVGMYCVLSETVRLRWRAWGDRRRLRRAR